LKARKLILASAAVLALLIATYQIRANAQQPIVTESNADQMIKNARTPADHEALAAFFRQDAAEDTKKADLHQRWADTYRKLNISKPGYMAQMCDSMAVFFRKAADGSEKLAAMHEEMAKQAKPN
jgi:hypothetical protein